MIGIDTNILIWGLDRAATVGIEHRIPLAVKFFEFVTAEKIAVCIPSQALAEFLVRNSEEERQAALAQIDTSFPIAPLDFPASYLASEITSDRDHMEEVRKTFGITRHVVKADVNIIASAIAFGATHLVTGNENEMRTLAKGRIIVVSLEEYVSNYIDRPEEVPKPPKDKQGTLFEPGPSDDGDAANHPPAMPWLCRPCKPHPLRPTNHLSRWTSPIETATFR